MKELFKKIFDKKIVTPLISGIGVVAIFEYIIFPGLTASNTFLNVLSVIIAVFVFAFVYHLLKIDRFMDPETIEPGETELDYLPKEEVVKKKRNPKQFPEVKSEDSFVKTRNKIKKNPTQTIIHPKVLGEHQIKNGDPLKSKKK
jgi:hypothetical protein